MLSQDSFSRAQFSFAKKQKPSKERLITFTISLLKGKLRAQNFKSQQSKYKEYLKKKEEYLKKKKELETQELQKLIQQTNLTACCLFCEIVKFWFSRPIPREPF